MNVKTLYPKVILNLTQLTCFSFETLSLGVSLVLFLPLVPDESSKWTQRAALQKDRFRGFQSVVITGARTHMLAILQQPNTHF